MTSICKCRAPKPRPFSGSRSCATCNGRFLGALTARVTAATTEEARPLGQGEARSIPPQSPVNVLEHRETEFGEFYIVEFDGVEFKVHPRNLEWHV